MRRELDKVRGAIVPVEQDEERGYSVSNPTAWPRMSGMFTFRYSSTEIYSQGGDLHVKLKETRYENGHLKTEECEGTMDRQAYDRMVDEAQSYFLDQVAGFAKLLWLPFSRGR